MVDKEELKCFVRFCDSASDRQLAERRSQYEEFVGVLQVGSDLKRDYQFLLRKIVEEQAARFEVNASAQRRQTR